MFNLRKLQWCCTGRWYNFDVIFSRFATIPETVWRNSSVSVSLFAYSFACEHVITVEAAVSLYFRSTHKWKIAILCVCQPCRVLLVSSRRWISVYRLKRSRHTVSQAYIRDTMAPYYRPPTVYAHNDKISLWHCCVRRHRYDRCAGKCHSITVHWPLAVVRCCVELAHLILASDSKCLERCPQLSRRLCQGRRWSIFVVATDRSRQPSRSISDSTRLCTLPTSLRYDCRLRCVIQTPRIRPRNHVITALHVL